MPNPEKIECSPKNTPENNEAEKWQPLEIKDWPQDMKKKWEILNEMRQWVKNGASTKIIQKIEEYKTDDISANNLKECLSLCLAKELKTKNQELLPQDLIDLSVTLAKDAIISFNARQQIIEALGQQKSRESINALILLTEDDGPVICEQAVKALGQQTNQAATEKLIDIAKNEDSYGRIDAIKALGFQTGEKIIETLLTLTEDDNFAIRGEAIKSLSRQKDERVVKKLSTLIEKNDIYTREQAVLALGQQENEKATDTLLALAQNEKQSSAARFKAIEALGRQASEEAIEKLLLLAKDQEYLIRGQAILALSQQKNEKILDLLLVSAQDESHYVRAQAAKALGRQDSEKAVKALMTLARDRAGDVQLEAIEALGRQTSGKALLELVSLIKSRNLKLATRELVVAALGQQTNEKAIEILSSLVNDKNPKIGGQALSAIIRKKCQSSEYREKIIENLIAAQEPALSNPALELLFASLIEIENPLLKLNDIIEQLKKECQEKYPRVFVDLIVLGSMSKGYWLPSSDLDWCLIFSNEGAAPINPETIKQIKNNFQKMAKAAGFKLCADNSFNFSQFKNSKQTNEQSPLCLLFNGMFFGDRKHLIAMQKFILENIDFAQWQKSRWDWQVHLSNYLKMKDRFGLTNEEVNYIISHRAFLWGLPPLGEMKKRYNNKNI